MTERQRQYLDALQAMLAAGEQTTAWKVCERAGFSQSTLSTWKKEHAAAVAAGEPSVHQDFYDEHRAIRESHRNQIIAERALEPEIVEPEIEEEIPEVLAAYLSALEAGLGEHGRLDRMEAWDALVGQGWQVSFDDVMDAIEGGHKKASRRFNQLKRRTTIRMEDRLRERATNGTRGQDANLALQILRVDKPETWNPRVRVDHVHQLEEKDRDLIEKQSDWFKSLVKVIPASAGT